MSATLWHYSPFSSLLFIDTMGVSTQKRPFSPDCLTFQVVAICRAGKDQMAPTPGARQQCITSGNCSWEWHERFVCNAWIILLCPIFAAPKYVTGNLLWTLHGNHRPCRLRRPDVQVYFSRSACSEGISGYVCRPCNDPMQKHNSGLRDTC